MVHDHQVWLQVHVIHALLPGKKGFYLDSIPALEGILEQVQDHFVIINKENELIGHN